MATINGTNAADSLLGTLLADLMFGLGGNDTLLGLDGSDTLDGGLGADSMNGGVGDDTYIVDNVGDRVIEGAGQGTDTIRSSITLTAAPNVEHLLLTGTANINGRLNSLANSVGNSVTGNNGINSLFGGLGHDVLDGRLGADTMSGGGGNDTYFVDNVGDRVIEAANGGIDTIRSSVSLTAAANVEHLVLTGAAALTGRINSAVNSVGNSVTGNSGNNTLFAGHGNDILDGGLGADNMQGGFGNDTYFVDNAGDFIVELDGQGIDTVRASISHSTHLEHLILTGTGNLTGTIRSTAGSIGNSITGNTGNNRLFAEHGNDVLNGGIGADFMAGGTGNDTYFVDNINDRVFEIFGAGIDTIRSTVTHFAVANVEHLILLGSANINGSIISRAGETGNSITGNSGNNILSGALGNDVLIGGAGNDILYGGEGNDWLRPGAGSDAVRGVEGHDTVDYSDATSGVEVRLGNNGLGGASGDTYDGIEDVIGSRFNDILSATITHSLAAGGAGDDRIEGSSAHYDRMRGDDGFDLLVGDFFSAEDFWLQYNRGMDTLEGFGQTPGILPNEPQDHIFVVGSEFGLSTAGGQFLSSNEFNSGNGPPSFNSTQRFYYETSTRILWADRDGSGQAFAPVEIAYFGTGSDAPTAADIFVI